MPVKEKSIHTVEPVQSGDCFSVQPEFGRVPDCQRLFGIKRGIKTVLLRERGNKHGIRLIYLQSVRDYLYANMERGDVKNEETALPA